VIRFSRWRIALESFFFSFLFAFIAYGCVPLFFSWHGCATWFYWASAPPRLCSDCMKDLFFFLFSPECSWVNRGRAYPPHHSFSFFPHCVSRSGWPLAASKYCSVCSLLLDLLLMAVNMDLFRAPEFKRVIFTRVWPSTFSRLSLTTLGNQNFVQCSSTLF